ncbi:Thionin [Trema orientale]|uniref:Thionin n=1 Tax=Trema orientale TaxID=63057 RepID=A0A2P5FXP6_TREOI|nr:Thionin [Trema orientale]
MASLNGMACCPSDVNRRLYYICNPLIKEYKQLSISMHDHGKDQKLILVDEPSVSKEFTLICTYLRNHYN